MLNSKERNLAIVTGSTQVFAILGAILFHMRFLRGGTATELLGWSVLIGAGLITLSIYAVQNFGPKVSNNTQRIHIGILSSSCFMLVIPSFAFKFFFQQFSSQSQFGYVLIIFFHIIVISIFSIAIAKEAFKD